MKIDRHLDISQGFCGRGKWRDFVNLPKGSGLPGRPPPQAKGKPLSLHCRQDSETAGSQEIFKLGARVDPAVQLLAPERKYDAKTQPAKSGKGDRQPDLGRAWSAGSRRRRDDASFRGGKGLLLHRLGEARQERLVNAAIGIRGRFELAQPNLRLPRGRRLLEHLAHAPVDGFFLAFRDLKLALVALADA